MVTLDKNIKSQENIIKVLAVFKYYHKHKNIVTYFEGNSFWKYNICDIGCELCFQKST